MSSAATRRALVSVSDKSGLADFVRGLIDLGFEIVSTGGTRRFLEEQGLDVVDVSTVTGFPEILHGRVKTLHPLLHGAILGRPDRQDDAAEIRAHGIVPFELVVCNLYPFEQTIAREGTTVAEAIEQIDVGGPSMVRAAAKNHAGVAVVTDPAQYPQVLSALRSGGADDRFRRRLAAAAFETTARYDRAIADYLARLVAENRGAPTSEGDSPTIELPETLRLEFRRGQLLRYGENPHQRAAFYVEREPPPASLAAAKQLHGKELSYNNLLDLDAALAVVGEFDRPAVAVVKHNNPCGCGVGETIVEAFERAWAGDPVSAFGSILGFNRSVDPATAEKLCEPDHFVEAIVAPAFDEAALQLLTTRPKWKKSVRLVVFAPRESRAAELPTVLCPLSTLHYHRVTGGLLVQKRDDRPDAEADWKTVTDRSPTEAEWDDLRFAWRVCKHVKSNAIVLAQGGAVVGVGAGQMSRLDSVQLAAQKAGDRSRGAVLASDAFFPFRDGVDEAARAGVTAIIQPGASVRDDEAITACNEQGLTMLFTGRRHFRH